MTTRPGWRDTNDRREVVEDETVTLKQQKTKTDDDARKETTEGQSERVKEAAEEEAERG